MTSAARALARYVIERNPAVEYPVAGSPSRSKVSVERIVGAQGVVRASFLHVELWCWPRMCSWVAPRFGTSGW